MAAEHEMSMDRVRRSLAAICPPSLRTVADMIGVAWWEVDASGTVVASDGPGLRAVGLRPGEAVGRNLFDDWPEWAARSPVVEVRAVLTGECAEARCRYEMYGHTWNAVVRLSWVNDSRGAIVATWPEGGSLGAHGG